MRRRFLTAARCAGLLLLVAAPGCREASTLPPAQPRTIGLSWHEAPGPKGETLVVDVRRFVVRPNGWSVSASVKNDTRVAITIGRPHHPGGTEFGVLVLASPDSRAVDAAGPGVFASRFAPDIPRLLAAGATWSGTFSGRGRLAVASYVRVEFGRFTTVGAVQQGVPWRFRYITDHVLRLSR